LPREAETLPAMPGNKQKKKSAGALFPKTIICKIRKIVNSLKQKSKYGNKEKIKKYHKLDELMK
jgi:hypothetical protein